MRSAVLTVIIGAAFLLVSAAEAQVVMPRKMLCGPTKNLIAEITGPKYAERGFFEGIEAASKKPVKVFANPATGTFTVILFPAPEMGCLIITGEELKVSPAAPGVEKAL